MQLLPVFSLFLTVHSLAIEQRSCVSSDVIAVAQQVTDPHYFCAWYLSDGRTRSPIQNIGANALLKACKCITSVEPAGANAKNLDAIAKAARLQSFVSATCSSTSDTPISKEFKDSPSFCSFFDSFERHDSPIPNLNVPAVRHACKCVLQSPTTSEKKSNTKVVSTSTKKSNSKSSSSSKKPVAKTSSTLSVRSSSKPVSKTSSSKTSTIKSSSSNVFSGKSSSPSKLVASKTSSKLSSSKTTISAKISSSTKSSSKIPSSQITLSKTSSVSPSGVKSNTPSKSGSSSSSTSLRSSTSSKSSTRTSSATAPSSTASRSSSTQSTSSSVQSTSTLDAYEIITSDGLEAFCTTYLDYTIPSTTMTVTAFATITEMNNLTLSTTFTAISTSTETDIVSVTVSVDEIVDKRSVATPNALAAYPEGAISSGCSRAVTLPATQTIAETITLTSIETIATTIITTAYETEASIATELATSTATALAPVYTGTPCGNQPRGAIWKGSYGRYRLCCAGSFLTGQVIASVSVTNMEDCLSHCPALNCTGVTLYHGLCSLVSGSVRLLPSQGRSAAIVVQ